MVGDAMLKKAVQLLHEKCEWMSKLVYQHDTSMSLKPMHAQALMLNEAETPTGYIRIIHVCSGGSLVYLIEVHDISALSVQYHDI